MVIIHKTRQIAVLTWDFKEDPDFDKLLKIIYDFNAIFAARSKIFTIDTGGDENAIVIGNELMSEKEAEEHYEKLYSEDNDTF